MTRSARPRPTPFLALAGFLCLSHPVAAADAPPTLDVEATCKSAIEAQASVSDNATVDGCLRSEREAKAEATRRWSDYTPAAKTQCEKQFQAGGFPSYVEMVTCLELASGTVPTQPGGAGTGSGTKDQGRTERNSDSTTPQADPNQRTNPIDVLNKP